MTAAGMRASDGDSFLMEVGRVCSGALQAQDSFESLLTYTESKLDKRFL